MVEFGTRAWFDEFVARAARLHIDLEPPLIVEARVLDPADADADIGIGIGIWHLRVGSSVEVAEGEAAAATVALVCDRDTAALLASGTINAQEAISSGRLQVNGDIAAVVAAAPTLAGLDSPDAR